MATIFVEKIHERAFNNVCLLLNTSFGDVLRSKLGIRFDDGKIVYGENEFVLQGRQDSAEVKAAVTQEGANWFKGIRDNSAIGNSNSKWVETVSEIAKLYHKQYPVVEYAPIEGDSDIDAEDVKEKILSCFFPNKSAAAFTVDESIKKNAEDFYAVSIRMSLNAGTGAPVPALCKVYFKKVKDMFSPVSKKSAGEIENFLKNVMPSESATDNSDGAMIIDTALDALYKCVQSSSSNANFGKYLYYGEKERAITDLLKNSKHDDVVLYCSEMEVKGITHIVLKSYTFDMVENGKAKFRITVGLNNNLNVQCLDCKKMLIVNNEINYKYNDEKRTVSLNLSAANMGLTDDQLVEILNSGHFAKHQMIISCPDNVRAGANGCTRTHCENNSICMETEEGTVYKCKNCPYPEIVYTLPDGEKCFTKDLVICKNRLGEATLAKPDDVKICPVCGRKFIGSEERCPTCLKFDLSNSVSLKTAAKVYKKYRNILPVSVRLFSAFKKKYCIEDEEILLFMLGRKKWIFNKTCIMKNGYLKSPERMYR